MSNPLRPSRALPVTFAAFLALATCWTELSQAQCIPPLPGGRVRVGLDVFPEGPWDSQVQSPSAVFELANESGHDAVLHFTTEQRYDLVLSIPRGGVVWRWSDGRVFAPTASVVHVADGASLAFAEELPIGLPFGAYSLEFSLVSAEFHRAALTFVVGIDPAASASATLAGEAGVRGGQGSVSLAKVAEATRRIREISRSAFVIWTGGHRKDGRPLSVADETNRWDFLAVALQADGVRVWRLRYDGKWAIRETNEPVMGIEFVDLEVVRMDVTHAWSLAVAAGHSPPFQWWALQKSLSPHCPNPVYIFGQGTRHIFVDTVTGEVTSDR